MPCTLTLATALQFSPASVPDGAHQLRVFARDATGTNVGYSASFPSPPAPAERSTAPTAPTRSSSPSA
ncbi:MAG TPA: hypothetical protein VLK59_05155 [Solirubrobacteraceae bacterium]|nr:hypothetical protein [Solirubrobacteraceae bacterium]